MLLEADADINQATSNGSCLHEAALYGKTDVVKFLLEVSHMFIPIFIHFSFPNIILFSILVGYRCEHHE